mgnify:CR=1 FL=1
MVFFLILIKISLPTFEHTIETYPIPIPFPTEGAIVPEVTAPIVFPFASTIG